MRSRLGEREPSMGVHASAVNAEHWRASRVRPGEGSQPPAASVFAEATTSFQGVLSRVLMFTVRYGIALALIVAGQVVLIADAGPRGAGWEGWALFTGAGLAILLLNGLFRMGA